MPVEVAALRSQSRHRGLNTASAVSGSSQKVLCGPALGLPAAGYTHSADVESRLDREYAGDEQCVDVESLLGLEHVLG